MKQRHFNGFIGFIVVITMLPQGCQIASSDTGTIMPGSPKNTILSIYDKNNTEICQIESYGVVALIDDGMIYMKVPNSHAHVISDIDFYRYERMTKKSIKLGTVKGWDYEASFYTSVMNNNHFYLIATVGDHYVGKGYLKLFDFNLTKNTMSILSSEKDSSYVHSMTVVDNKLYMIKANTNAYTLVEYNLETKETKTIKSYAFNDSTKTGEELQQIASDDSTISILRAKLNTVNNVQLFMDVYDHEMNFLRTVDVSSIPYKTLDTLTGTAINDPLWQPVADFFFLNNRYFYFKSCSILTFLGQIVGNTVSPIMGTDNTFCAASEPMNNSDIKLFYQGFNYDNNLYLLNAKDGSLKKAAFHTTDKDYCISTIARDSSNNLLITMNYYNPDSSARPPMKCYYINQSDLDFQ